MNDYSLFSIPIQNVKMDKAIQQITALLQGEVFQPVYFINAHCVNISQQDEEYFQIISQNEFNYADGAGMKIAARLFGKPLADNVNGTDLFPLLCSRLNESNYKMFLLGGCQDVIEKLVVNLETDYPGLNIAGHHHGYFDESENRKIVEMIHDSKSDILLVAMGVPQQEKWIHNRGRSSGVKVAMGVGGLFNFYSGSIPRAPKWMRRTGLEWLHRFLQEPSRLWKRYLIGNLLFLFRTLKRLINREEK